MLEDMVEELITRIKDMENKQVAIMSQNEELKTKCNNVLKANNEIKITVENLKSENEALKLQCSEKTKDVVDDGKLEELKNVWKKERENQKESFKEIVEQQIQDKTKDAVIQVIKEREDLVRDTVDKKKCFVVYGLKEKKNPVKFVRDKVEKELAKDIIKTIQDDQQGLEQEIEEIYRMGKYSEGCKRPMKIKLRSQASVEELLARTGKLVESEDYKEVWIKRDMNLEEREKEKKLRNEAREKNERRTESERKEFYWRVMDMRLRKWYIQGRE